MRERVRPTVVALLRSAAAVGALIALNACSDDSPRSPASQTTPPAKPPEYAWKEHKGHWYAESFAVGPWQEAAAEAVRAGGTLTTVNDAEENVWLAEAFDGRGGPDEVAKPCGGCCIWIGYHRVDGSWVWQDGTPPGFENICETCFRETGGTHMYLHTASNTGAPPRTWNYNPAHDRRADQYLHGIIEVTARPLAKSSRPVE